MHAAVLAQSKSLTAMLFFVLNRNEINSILHGSEKGSTTLPYLIEHSTETLISPQGIILQMEKEFHMEGQDVVHGFSSLEECFRMKHGAIGAKRGGTQEQCSQKLFELAEIFRKIIRVFLNY